jgi:nicotinamide-nucleotide amidase
LKPMFTEAVLPIVAREFPHDVEVEMRNYRIAGLGESAVEARVGEPLLTLGVELGYCARPGEVDLRLIGAPLLLESAERVVREKLGPHIVSEDLRSLEKVVVDLLTSRGETLAIAESCTGGAIANRITNVAGSSAVFVEGFVTYANEAKARSLGVDPALIRAHGAVSHEVAGAMAQGAQRVADYALATTGIAGPGGGSEEKPAGTVFIALASKGREVEVQRHRFPTDRENFKHLVTQTALELLRRALREGV